MSFALDSGPCSLATNQLTANSGTGACQVTATKAADSNYNQATAQVTVSLVPWTINGFFQPVDMGAAVWNTVKAGSTVPLKFEIFAGLTELTTALAVKSVSSVQVTCGTGVDDTVEEIVTTGGTVLRYDATAGQFIYNWQTPKKPGTCHKVTMTAQDDSSIWALFKLK